MKPLTKNIFLNTVFCNTLGWRLRNEQIHPGLSKSQLFRMEQGKEIHKRARRLYPGGVYVKEANSSVAAAHTRELLSDQGVGAIFEGAFLAGNCVARADILVQDSGSWELIEVKSSATVKDELIDDLAYTTMVAKAAGLSPSAASLMLIDRNYRLGMPDENLFVKEDVTEQAEARAEEFGLAADQVDAASGRPDEPEPELAPNCRKCDEFRECTGKGVENHIFDIPRIRNGAIDQLIAAGITSIDEIPDDFRLSANQKRMVGCVKSGKSEIDPAIGGKLAKFRWPAYYLDFETVSTAIPLWADTAPYEHLPIQYSLHVCESVGSITTHREYLADAEHDPRRELAEQLLEDLEGEGSIVSYSSFEKTTINALGRRFPDLSEGLQALTERIVDLEECVKCISHPGFHGRTSIKVALPTLVPELTYDGLEIANGDDALVTFAMMAQNKMDAEEMKGKRAAMLEYCKMDTLAMVRLHEKMEKLAGSRREAVLDSFPPSV